MGSLFVKKNLFISLILVQVACFASFLYSFDSIYISTVPEIRIPNTHIVDANDATGAIILRGKQPESDADFSDLAKYGVNEFLIFKNDVKGEVEIEKAKLRQIGIKDKNIHNMKFRWKKIKSFKEACTQTIEAFAILQNASKNGTKLYFHCTMGEDRTGYLAGLYILLSRGLNPKSVFYNEMCKHGYSSGNPHKPDDVVDILDSELTPIYVKMAYKINKGFITPDKLDKSVCEIDPESDTSFNDNPEFEIGDYDCRKWEKDY